MQTTLRINTEICQLAGLEAARRGVGVDRFIEDLIRASISQSPLAEVGQAAVEERNQLMDALLKRTAHFRAGDRVKREELYE